MHASVINDAKNKKNEAQQELDNLNSQIDEIQAAQSDLQEEMDAYDDQLMALLTDMDLLKRYGYSVDDIIDDVQSCLEPHMFPVEILAIDERPFFHFKTNRIELSKELKRKKYDC